MQLEKINALAELEEAGLEFEPSGNDEVSLVCPAHDDNQASASLNTKKNVWRCHVPACGAKGDIASLIALHLQVERRTVVERFKTKYDLSSDKTLDPDTVERFHSSIKSAGPLLQALYDRCISDELIRQARIGFFKGRLTIPVYNVAGQVVDILRYLPGAPGNQKMRHTKGYSALRLYRPNDLSKNEVWIHGGPMKALVASAMMPDSGHVSSTGGEGSWQPDWSKLFEGKRVVVCMDIDAHGLAAARRIAQNVTPYAKEVLIATLPLDPEKHPKGDFNDFAADRGDVSKIELSPFEPLTTGALEKDYGDRNVKLSQVTKPDNMGYRLHFESTCSAIDETPYLVPREVRVHCDRAQPQCGQCPIKTIKPRDEDGATDTEIRACSEGILELAGTGSATHEKSLKKAVGIPSRCKVAELIVLKSRRVYDVRLTPQLTISGQGSGSIMQPAMIVDQEVDLNTPYDMTGKLYSHPVNSKATLVIEHCEQTEDSLDSFKPTESELAELHNTFAVEEHSLAGLRSRLRQLYDDLEANVSRVYERTPLHLAYDLAYHSVLQLEINGRKINGWANILVAGDSAQGKSEAFIRLRDHYGLGERVECKNATVAGLLGGLQQLGNRWFVSWGIIPTHDRRLVALEEVKGAPVEVLGKLTDARSSGIAEIPKIERRRAHARTRLIFISNPRSNRQVSGYGFGVEAYQELIGSPEDLRRFDVALMVAAGQVPASVMHETRQAEHFATGHLCRRLILWSWTRDVDSIRWADGCSDALRAASEKLASRYSERVPLVDRGTIMQKIARLSAALAARVFSTDGKRFDTLIIRPYHIEYVTEFIDQQYSDPVVGYLEFSRAIKAAHNLRDGEKVQRYVVNTRFPRSLIEGLLGTDRITQQDIMDWCDTDRETSASQLSFFVRFNALRRHGRTNQYEKTGGFITLLRKMELQDYPDDRDTEDDEL